MINLELYKIFVEVANELNVTKASEHLNISQPSVTKHIKNLENELNLTLFKRSNKGLRLTDIGLELYESLKNPINEIIRIDSKFTNEKNINIGSHNHLLNIIFGDCISKFYLEYPNINLNLKCAETIEMLKMLENGELDIVFSKKVNDFKVKNIEYLKLGFLNDIFICNKNSNFANKIVSKQELEEATIYVPRKYAQTVTRLNNLLNNKNLKLKNSSYNTILEITSKTNSIGMITKEYIDEEKLEKYNLIETKTELSLKPIEFGIYFNINRKREVNFLIKIISEKFKA
mgnify:FL=1|jgi:transcriptional regulatory protein